MMQRYEKIIFTNKKISMRESGGIIAFSFIQSLLTMPGNDQKNTSK